MHASAHTREMNRAHGCIFVGFCFTQNRKTLEFGQIERMLTYTQRAGMKWAKSVRITGVTLDRVAGKEKIFPSDRY